MRHELDLSFAKQDPNLLGAARTLKVEEMDPLPGFDIFRSDLLVRNDHSVATPALFDVVSGDNASTLRVGFELQIAKDLRERPAECTAGVLDQILGSPGR
jgi:hypothetical protein